MTDDAPPLKTIQRAFEIMDVLKEQKEVGVAELSRRLDLPKSTVHDYLRTLRSMGYVINENGSYRLGFQLLELGGQVKYRNRLFHVAKPELERLVDKTGELVSINVEERGRFVILHTEFGSESLRLGIYPGLKTPIHTHAGGKVILAHLGEERFREIIDEHGLEARTEHTITDRSDLFETLTAIREREHAYDREERIKGLNCVAVPILSDDDIAGSLSVSGPVSRMDEDRIESEILPELRRAANIIELNQTHS